MRPLLPLLLAVALCGGCMRSFERAPVEKTRFLLSLPAPDPGPKPGGALTVDSFRVSSPFDRKGFVYRTGEETFDSDFRFEWFGNPGAVLREAAIDWLRDAGPFASVERGALAGSGWLLRTDVERLYADRRPDVEPAAVLTGRFQLLDLRGARPRQVASLRFDEREPAAGGSPQALVDAWGRALARALDRLEPDLRAAVGTPTRSGAR